MPPLAHGVKDWQGSEVCDYIRQEFECDGERAFAIFHDCRGRKNPILTFNRVTGLWEGVESAKKSKSRLYAINQGMLEMVTLLRSIDRNLSKLVGESAPESAPAEAPGVSGPPAEPATQPATQPAKQQKEESLQEYMDRLRTEMGLND